jgi:hypothetical protein
MLEGHVYHWLYGVLVCESRELVGRHLFTVGQPGKVGNQVSRYAFLCGRSCVAFSFLVFWVTAWIWMRPPGVFLFQGVDGKVGGM